MALPRCALLALAALCVPALATPSALLQIPTSDVLDKDTACFDVGGTMYTTAHPRPGDFYLETEFATSHNVEFGYDFPLNAPAGGILNAKWRFDAEGDVTWAVGFSGLEPRERLEPFLFVAGQWADGKWCYHGGAAWDARSRHGHGFVGVSYSVNDRFTWMADYLSGSHGAATAGFSATFGGEDDWFLMAGYVRDNTGGGHGVYVDVGCVVDF